MASPPIVPGILILVSIHREGELQSVCLSASTLQRERGGGDKEMPLFPIQLNACWYTEWQSEIGLFGFAFFFPCVQYAPGNDMVSEHKRRSIKMTVYLLLKLKTAGGEGAY